ncbi:MAG TPA: universal stress protein [Rubrobacter sp.]|nr:universal stress protein [Rubrobacter sp.]
MTIFPIKILLAIDGSGESELATRRAVDLADTAGSELHVVYIGQLPNFLMNDPDIMGFYRKLYDDIEQESLEILWRLTWEVKAAGGDVAGSHLGMGVVDLEIVVLAKELQADLIVMGCRGHRGIRRAIEGSISDAVIRHAPCPVLVVRSHESAQDPKWPALFAGGR